MVCTQCPLILIFVLFANEKFKYAIFIDAEKSSSQIIIDHFQRYRIVLVFGIHQFLYKINIDRHEVNASGVALISYENPRISKEGSLWGRY